MPDRLVEYGILVFLVQYALQRKSQSSNNAIVVAISVVETKLLCFCIAPDTTDRDQPISATGVGDIRTHSIAMTAYTA